LIHEGGIYCHSLYSGAFLAGRAAVGGLIGGGELPGFSPDLLPESWQQEPLDGAVSDDGTGLPLPPRLRKPHELGGGSAIRAVSRPMGGKPVRCVSGVYRL